MSNKNMTGSVLQDLYLEFFAVFIPGFILVAGIITLISMCHYCIFEKVSFCSDWFSKINFTHSFFFLVVISYALGAILHRKKPEHPDKESAFHEWCCKKKKNPQSDIGAANFSDPLPYNYTLFKPREFKKYDFVKYPYKNLRRYLIEHGLHHLLKFVPWCGVNNVTARLGSRTVINELKTIIKYYGPKEYYSDLTRSESNVRLFTALWHTFKYLLIVGFVCFLFVVAWAIFHRNNLHCLYGSFVFIVIFYSLLKAQQGIIKSLHYLRVKEIVTILIQANILRNEYPNKAIWIDIAEKENLFKQSLREMTPIPCKDCVYEDVCAFFNLDRQVQATEISSSQAVTTNTNRCNSCGRVHIEITDNSTNINN